MYNKIINDHQDQMLKDIEKLVNIPSIRDLSSSMEGKPFGENIAFAMSEFEIIAKRLGFKVSKNDGFTMIAQIGDLDDHVGVLAHIDVVEANENDWITPPFKMSIREGVLYGRGVNDDKGPLIAALYAAYFVSLKTKGWKRSIRIIVGGAEETTWECVDHYFKTHKQPDWAFSPDGNFPIVNGEMGVLQLSLKFKKESTETYSSSPRLNYLCHNFKVNNVVYEGDRHLSRNPQRGRNAIDVYFSEASISKSSINDFIKDMLHDEYNGRRLKINKSHESMNDLSVCMMSLNTDGNTHELCLDVRYPINTSAKTIKERFTELSKEYSFDFEVIKVMEPIFVDEKSELIQSLKNAYEEVMDEPAEVLTKGGASYARVLERGVAFGATFEGEDPRPHMSNENISIKSLMKACEIYCHSLEKLVSK